MSVPDTPRSEDGPVTIGNVRITPKGQRIDVTCVVCTEGMEVGVMFGPIPGEVLIAEWAKQHLHLPKKPRRR